MSRKFAVTRSVKTTEVTALVFNKVTAEAENKTHVFAGTFKDEKAMEKAAEKVFTDGDFKFIEIVETNVSSKVMGITEQAFLENAVELNSKTRKPINE